MPCNRIQKQYIFQFRTSANIMNNQWIAGYLIYFISDRISLKVLLF